MEDSKILYKAIDKATQNGYRGIFHNWEDAGIPFGVVMQHIGDFIFSHNFAKAFWGEEKIDLIGIQNTDPNGELLPVPDELLYISWQYHLQQMVLVENPIKYLEKFL